MSSDLSRTLTEAAEEQRVLSSRLREARLTLGLTQQDAATVAGVSRPAVAEMESGRRRVSALELRRLSRLYRRPVAWLLGLEHDGDPDPAIVAAVSGLGAIDQDAVLRFARFLASQQKERT